MSFPRISISPSTSPVVNCRVFVCDGSLGGSGCGSVVLCRGWPSTPPCRASGFVLAPTLNHSPYNLPAKLPALGYRHLFASCPSLPQLKHNPTNFSYLYAALTQSPPGLATWPPRHSGLSRGTSTLIWRNQAWFKANALQSTSTTLPIPRPISQLASSLIRSNGNPHTWT